MRDFKELKVWDKAHRFTVAIYGTTKSFPKEELFGLTSQIRRSSASIGANLAEGSGRNSDGEMGRFVQIAMGSASELEYHLLLARDLRLLDRNNHDGLLSQLTEIRKMLSSLSSVINTSRGTASKLRAKS